jgi:3-phosphoshikimate 1-carboxyvinyltransferase
MKALGADFELANNTEVVVTPIDRKEKRDVFIDANQSGSTLRFLIPIALALYNHAKFTGSKRLLERPLDEYFKIFDKMGVLFSQKDGVLEFNNSLKSGNYIINGDVSSQYVTGLMYALSVLEGDSMLVINPPINSIGYINITIDVLEKSGIKIEKSGENSFFIKGSQKILPK